MTLVVGYADKDIGFLVGDTLLSYPIEQYNPREPFIEKFHALKIQILNPDIAVAFAGNVQLSLSILKQLSKELIIVPQLNVCERLLELHCDYINQHGLHQKNSDFLVLFITPENTKKLARIADGSIDFVQRAYIGDYAEYVNFSPRRMG